MIYLHQFINKRMSQARFFLNSYLSLRSCMCSS